jgi:hypothetical protein
MQREVSNLGLGLKTPTSYHHTTTLIVKNFGMLLFILSCKDDNYNQYFIHTKLCQMKK